MATNAPTDEAVQLCVEGMTCANCALRVERYLNKQGLEAVNVRFAEDAVSFRLPSGKELSTVIDGIEHIGYHVVSDDTEQSSGLWSSVEWKLAISAMLSIPLVAAMFLPWAWLRDPWVQFGLALPVYLIGLQHFGRSGWQSLLGGLPNMDVLITLGASAAFGYSTYGLLAKLGPDFMFFETAATIITLVMLGNVIEHRSVQRTTSSIRALSAMQADGIRLVETAPGGEVKLREASLSEAFPGAIAQVLAGEKVPLDATVLEGNAQVDESLLTGESLPVDKRAGDTVIGGTVLRDGMLRIRVDAVGKDTVLSGIIQMVRDAALNKPPVQRLADRISAYFVPVVVGIALLTLVLAYLVFNIPLRLAIIQAVAVLVISCPCAMGLATPTAVAVGLGRAARQGILIKGATTLEHLAGVKRIILDKTGTLTTGNFSVLAFTPLVHETLVHDAAEASQVGSESSGLSEASTPDLEPWKMMAASLAARSDHPVARSVAEAFAHLGAIPLDEAAETKGYGMEGRTADGISWRLGSARWFASREAHQKAAEQAPNADLYLFREDEAVAAMQLADELRAGAHALMGFLQERGIEPVIVSGDRQNKVQAIADELGIESWYAEQLPAEKLALVEQLQHEKATAMLGDGINDAPALEKAQVGISLAEGTRIAQQAAGIVLLGGNLEQVANAFRLGEQTLLTIRQNLFWAFFYNVLAIPVAAVGLLSPMIAALAMACSDVMVIGNSLRLNIKRLV